MRGESPKCHGGRDTEDYCLSPTHSGAHQGCGTSWSRASMTRSTSSNEWNRWVEMRSGVEKVPAAAFWLGSVRRAWGTELLRMTMLWFAFIAVTAAPEAVFWELDWAEVRGAL